MMMMKLSRCSPFRFTLCAETQRVCGAVLAANEKSWPRTVVFGFALSVSLAHGLFARSTLGTPLIMRFLLAGPPSTVGNRLT